MFESINIKSSVPVYVQIENLVQFAIASGRLKADHKLPSAQVLAEKIQVNPNTVAKAYRDLEVMGLVYTWHGMGVFVEKGAQGRCSQQCRKQIVGRLHEVVSEAKAAAMSAQEIKQICRASMASNASIYGDPPAAMLALVKKQKSSKKK